MCFIEKPLSIMLLATSLDVMTAYQNIRLVKEQLKPLRDNTNKVFEEDVCTRATKLATIAEAWVDITQSVGRMTRRTNVPSTTCQPYYKLAVFVPTIDHLISQLVFRFSTIQVNATYGLYLIPQYLDTMTLSLNRICPLMKLSIKR